jgi:hypothetical protein
MTNKIIRLNIPAVHSKIKNPHWAKSFKVYSTTLFKGTGCIASNGRMTVNDEMGTMGKEAVIANFMALSQHLPGGTEKNHKELWSGYLASRLILEPGTSQI